MSYPTFGTTPIKCGKRKCNWKGYETDLKQVKVEIGKLAYTQNVCPECGCDSYYFMTDWEVKAWERATQAAKQGEQQ